MSPALLALTVVAHVAGHVDISGPWKANPQDNPAFADPDVDDSKWPTIQMPGHFADDSPAFSHFAGVGWLRRTVVLDDKSSTPKAGADLLGGRPEPQAEGDQG